MVLTSVNLQKCHPLMIRHSVVYRNAEAHRNFRNLRNILDCSRETKASRPATHSYWKIQEKQKIFWSRYSTRVQALCHVLELPRSPRHRQVHSLQERTALWEVHHLLREDDSVTKKNGMNLNGLENRNGLSQMTEPTKVCDSEDLLATSTSSISKNIVRIT